MRLCPRDICAVAVALQMLRWGGKWRDVTGCPACYRSYFSLGCGGQARKPRMRRQSSGRSITVFCRAERLIGA